MKIAVSSTGATLESAVDPRFGRAKCFIVIDTDSNAYEARDNSVNLNAVQGAGIQAAKNVVDTGAQAIVTGNVGPKAFAVLSAAGVTVYTGASGTVRDAVDAFKTGALSSVGRANVEGHWM